MRATVVQVKCDRCKRVETVAVNGNGAHNGSASATGSPAFKALFEGMELVYEDLCSSCRAALKNVWKELKEWKRNIVQEFGPKVDPNNAAPLQPPPNYTPPIPHSSGKR